VPPGRPEPEAVRATVRSILDGPRYRDDETGADWARAVAEMFDGLADWTHAHPLETRLVLVACVVVLAGIVLHLAWVVRRDLLEARDYAAPSLDGAVERALEESAVGWSAAWRRLEAARSAGDLRTAVWTAHRLLLALLEHGGHLRVERWKTNAVYAREVFDARAAEVLGRWNGVYDRVVYAHAALDPHELDRLVAELDARRRAEASRARAGGHR
jgi:hypothetical protein